MQLARFHGVGRDCSNCALKVHLPPPHELSGQAALGGEQAQASDLGIGSICLPGRAGLAISRDTFALQNCWRRFEAKNRIRQDELSADTPVQEIAKIGMGCAQQT
jgi:hypothetical protein